MHGPRLFVAVGLLVGCTSHSDAPAEVVVAVAPVAEVPAPVHEPRLSPEERDLLAVDALLGSCQGESAGHPLGTAVRVEALGPWGVERVFRVATAASGERRLLVFENPDGDCHAFVLGTEAAAVRGDFLGDGTPHTAVLLSQANDDVTCNNDACPVALLVRDDAGVLLGAIDPQLGCETYALKAVRMFADRDSIELRCTAGSVDMERKVGLFHMVGPTLRPLLTFVAGRTSMELTEDQKRMCTSRSKDGSYKIKTKGAIPVVEVFEVTDLQAATRAEWTFSATEQGMIRGTATEVKLPAAKARCVSMD